MRLRLGLAAGLMLAIALLCGGEARAADALKGTTYTIDLDLPLKPPVLNTAPGPEYSDEIRDYGMTIGIERTRGGRIWAAWVAGGDSELAYFVAATSDDEGRTWSKPRLVIDPPDPPEGPKVSVLVGNLWCDPTGRMWLFFNQSLGNFDGRAGDWAITCDNPDAKEPKWSEPRRIWHGFTLCKPTVLKNGEWLLPISLWGREKIGHPALREAHHELDDQRMAHVFASGDQGKTWVRRGGVAFARHDFDEHMIVERKDGSLWMLARTLDGIAETTSSDGGRSWSAPRIAMPNRNARFFIRRLSSGRLLLVKHGRVDETTKKRSHLTAFVSDDDGKSWRGGLLLDERDGVSYPDGFQAPDGKIFISYDHNRAKDREVLLAVFTEEDVLAGKEASGKARMKGLINKALWPAKEPEKDKKAKQEKAQPKP